MLTTEVKNYIDKCILCWLATADAQGEPNVSPKEIFTHFDDNTFLIAHIASPQSIRNIEQNPSVCISFVDIFIQKGFKIKGKAHILRKQDEHYTIYEAPLKVLAGDAFPIAAVICVNVEKVEAIIAPSYRFYPEQSSEVKQIESALKAYGVRKD
jgi:uncharacterized protein